MGQQLLQGRVSLQMVLDSFAHHGVLAHEHNAATSQGDTDLLHLSRTDIVCTHNETFWVLIEQLLWIKKLVALLYEHYIWWEFCLM